MATKYRTVKLRMTEFSETFSEEPAENTEVSGYTEVTPVPRGQSGAHGANLVHRGLLGVQMRGVDIH